jgi:alpha-glucosidase
MIFQWQELLDEFTRSHDEVTKVLMLEATSSLENMIRYFGVGNRNGANIPFNFELIIKTAQHQTTSKTG